MSTFFDPETLWLNVTNALLGIVTLVCIVAVARVAVAEWAARMAHRTQAAIPDSHTFDIEGLGITMADGGERLDESSRIGRRSEDADSDPSGVHRSEN